MAVEVPVLTKSYVAGEDLSLSQFVFVKLYDKDTIVAAGAGEKAIGILQDDPKLGAMGSVMLIGESKMRCYASAGIAIGAAVGASAVVTPGPPASPKGAAITVTEDTDSDLYIIGTCTVPCDANGIGSCLLGGTPYRTSA